MSVKLGLSIYNKPWLIQPNAANNLLDYWEKVTTGEVQWDYRAANGKEEETDITAVFASLFETNKVIMAPTRSWALKNFEGFDGASVAIIPVTGPLMKADYCGDLGTASLSMLAKMAAATPGMQTIIYLFDSPGGTVDGTKAFADVIAACDQETIAVCDGMICSAAYWLASACDKIYAASETDIIGSIGTMMSMRDYTKAEEKAGIVRREFYATASKDKNKMFNDAMQGNGKALVEEHLDPTNDVFLKAVRSNRPGVSADALTGKTFLAEHAMKMGLIDGVKTLDEVLNEVSKPQQNNANNNYNITVMTLEQLKAEHPGIYSAAFEAGKAAGVTDERDRVGSWMAYSDIDLEAVKKGIEDGGEVSRKQQQEFFVKQSAKATTEVIRTDNPAPVATAQPEAQPTPQQSNVSEFTANCAKDMGLKLPAAK